MMDRWSLWNITWGSGYVCAGLEGASDLEGLSESHNSGNPALELECVWMWIRIELIEPPEFQVWFAVGLVHFIDSSLVPVRFVVDVMSVWQHFKASNFVVLLNCYCHGHGRERGCGWGWGGWGSFPGRASRWFDIRTNLGRACSQRWSSVSVSSWCGYITVHCGPIGYWNFAWPRNWFRTEPPHFQAQAPRSVHFGRCFSTKGKAEVKGAPILIFRDACRVLLLIFFWTANGLLPHPSYQHLRQPGEWDHFCWWRSFYESIRF